MNTKDFFAKMEQEGGYYELAKYGLKPVHIKYNTKLRLLWTDYLEKMEELESIENYLDDIKKGVE